MDSFYTGLVGSFVGGLFLAVTVTGLFLWEKKQANKTADKLVEDLKAMYYTKINGQDTSLKAKGKFN